jgi:hypothetical protein
MRRNNVAEKNAVQRECQSAQRTNAAPKMTTNAPSIEPRATPNDTGAAPSAGGASPAPVGELAGVDKPVEEPDSVPDGMLIDAEPEVMLEFPLGLALALELVKLALGPIALLLTVLTAPEIVARLLCTLATCVLAAETDGVTTDLLGTGAGAGPVMATWMRISSHWAPIHSSYRLKKPPDEHCHQRVEPPMASEPLVQMEKPPV